MGFGLSVKVEVPKVEVPKVEVPKVEVPKVEVPKVEVPKVDVAAATKSVTGAVSGAVDSAKSAVSGAVSTATSAVNDAVDTAKGAVDSAVSAATEAANSVVSVATKAVASLNTVAGAIADVAASFTGAIEDIALEPHLSLDANASFGKTKFEKGPVWIMIEMPSDEADTSGDFIRLFSSTGSYDAQKEFRDYIESTPETVDVLFDDVPMNESYSLEILQKDGNKRLVFKDIPYGDLRMTRNRL